MKKLLSVILAILFIMSLSGCKDSAVKAVENYLNEYNSLSDNVISDMMDVVKDEDINDKQKGIYQDIFKKQYQDLTYTIDKEEYNGDEAVITVTVNVYDLYKAQKDSSEYLRGHQDEFNNEDGNYDIGKFIDYKLDQMKNMTDKIDYTIEFYVVKTSDGWVVSNLSNTDLEKIHGIYNYES